MRKLPILALAAALALAASGADPYAGYIYPAGIQVGTTNRFVIGGQGLRNIKSVFFDNPGLEVVSFEVVPGFPNPANGFQRRHLIKWLDGIAAGNREEPPLPDDPHISEWRSNSWCASWARSTPASAPSWSATSSCRGTPFRRRRR